MTPQLKANGLVNLVLGGSVLLVLGSLGIAGYNLMTLGHRAFNTTSDGLPWGLPIVIYDYFVVLSTGLVFVACLAFVFGIAEFYAIAKRCLWLAFATLIAGGAVLMLELGHPLRSLYAIPLNMQYHSPMFWKVLFIGSYVVLLLALFYQITVMDWTHRSVRPVAIALFLAMLGLVFTAGALFGMMAMRPFWFDISSLRLRSDGHAGVRASAPDGHPAEDLRRCHWRADHHARSACCYRRMEQPRWVAGLA
jgi:molybdopterin-containing oxidoreductase family membrane subunit